MKKITYTLIVLFFIILTSETTRAVNYDYQPLAPIPGVTEGIAENPKGLEIYIANMFKLGVGVATALAVIMVIWGGIQYMTTDAWGHKEEGKERISSALLGLLLALSTVVIVNTIDKSILDINFDVLGENRLGNVDEFALEIPDGIKDVLDDPNFEERDDYTIEQPNNGGIPGEVSAGYKVDIPSGINVASKGKQIDVAIATKLQELQNNLSTNGITWAVTEAYPPSRNHKASCHQTGTCIDANFRNIRPTGQNVKKFIDSASAAGLRAVYEVHTQNQKDALVAGGAPADQIKVLGSWISAPHFSVYGN